MDIVVIHIIMFKHAREIYPGDFFFTFVVIVLLRGTASDLMELEMNI